MISLDDKRNALEVILVANGNRLTPEAVVAAARDAGHPLHDEFNWDDKSAAEQQRLDTARQIIRSVQINIKMDNRVISSVCYVRDPKAAYKEQGYVAMSQSRRQKEEAHQILMGELARVESAIRRSRQIAAVLNLSDELEELLERIVIIQRKVSQQSRRKVA
jgi:hypothetical protein